MTQYIAHVSMEVGESGGVMLTKPVDKTRRDWVLLSIIRNALGLKRLAQKQEILRMASECEGFYLKHKDTTIYITFTQAAYNHKKYTNGSFTKLSQDHVDQRPEGELQDKQGIQQA